MAALVLALAAAPALAQDTTTALRPGMSEADVRERWGEPVAVRRANEWTYFFYSNGMERSVGWYDVVFLQNGQVVDAIVRAPGRNYLGQSSSPPGRMPEPTLLQQPAPNPGGAEITGVRINP
jgi:hypothetical protein